MAITHIPLWVFAHHMAMKDIGHVSGKHIPEADRLLKQLLTADKVLVDDAYVDKMIEVAEDRTKHIPYIRMNAVVDGTWFEVDTIMRVPSRYHKELGLTKYRFGFMVYNVQEFSCDCSVTAMTNNEVEVWTGNSFTFDPVKNSFDFGVVRSLPEFIREDLIVMANIATVMSLFERKLNTQRKVAGGTLRSYSMGHYKNLRVRYISLTSPRPIPVPLGGTHASPGRHTVKGYWRKKDTPMERWVEAYKRGNPAYGEIIHEYGVGAKKRTIRLPPFNPLASSGDLPEKVSS